MQDAIEQIAHWIAESRHLVAFTGAGISTESGIPDFRTPLTGVWSQYNPEDFTYQRFLESRENRILHWARAEHFIGPIRAADPNPGHRALAMLERMGLLKALITQNVDGLHQKAGNSEEKVIELHGTVHGVSCLECGKRFDRMEISERIAAGDEAPECDECGGPLKPLTISFGQAMPVGPTRRAEEESAKCDVMLAIGSSLVVQPAALMPVIAKRAGARLVILTKSATPLDEIADLVVNESTSKVLDGVVKRVEEMRGEEMRGEEEC